MIAFFQMIWSYYHCSDICELRNGGKSQGIPKHRTKSFCFLITTPLVIMRAMWYHLVIPLFASKGLVRVTL